MIALILCGPAAKKLGKGNKIRDFPRAKTSLEKADIKNKIRGSKIYQRTEKSEPGRKIK
jgi:hypothetical protein